MKAHQNPLEKPQTKRWKRNTDRPRGGKHKLVKNAYHCHIDISRKLIVKLWASPSSLNLSPANKPTQWGWEYGNERIHKTKMNHGHEIQINLTFEAMEVTFIFPTQSHDQTPNNQEKWRVHHEPSRRLGLPWKPRCIKDIGWYPLSRPKPTFP